jgi:hypothetical protein
VVKDSGRVAAKILPFPIALGLNLKFADCLFHVFGIEVVGIALEYNSIISLGGYTAKIIPVSGEPG